jgi:hypothetical protein
LDDTAGDEQPSSKTLSVSKIASGKKVRGAAEAFMLKGEETSVSLLGNYLVYDSGS